MYAGECVMADWMTESVYHLFSLLGPFVIYLFIYDALCGCILSAQGDLLVKKIQIFAATFELIFIKQRLHSFIILFGKTCHYICIRHALGEKCWSAGTRWRHPQGRRWWGGPWPSPGGWTNPLGSGRRVTGKISDSGALFRGKKMGFLNLDLFLVYSKI